MNRRRKLIQISRDLKIEATDLAYLLTLLPRDARLHGAKWDPTNDTTVFCFISDEWDEVPPGEMIPELVIAVTQEGLDDFRARLAPVTSPTHGRWSGRDPNPQTIPRDSLGKSPSREPTRQMQPMSPGMCICDMAYTGRRTHVPDCPVKKR